VGPEPREQRRRAISTWHLRKRRIHEEGSSLHPVRCICSIAAVLLAEVVHHYFPKYVELHNYSAANSVRQKLYNWSTLNREWAAHAGRSQCTSPLDKSKSQRALPHRRCSQDARVYYFDRRLLWLGFH